MRLETTGIESEIVDDALETLGHVLMLEYDDVGRGAKDVRSDLRQIDGPVVLVRSSRGSYHIYGLALRSWDDVVVRLEESYATREYVREMTRRGVCTLRIGPKRRTEDDAIETPAPEPIAVTSSDGPIAVSRPHTARLRQLAEETGSEDVARRLEAIETGAVDGIVPVGSQLPRTRYETRGGER